MLDVEQDLATVAVVLDENVEGVRIVDPAEKTRVWRQGDDGVFDDREMPLERLGVLLKQRVDEPEKLHDSLVLSKILVTCTRMDSSAQSESGRAHRRKPTLEQETVFDAVAAVDAQLPWALFRREDLEICAEAADADDPFARLVRT